MSNTDGGAGTVLIRQTPVKQVREITVRDAVNKITSIAIANARKAYDECENPDEKTTTTIRLPNSVAEYYAVLAKDLGISLQNAIVISLVGLIESEGDNSAETMETNKSNFTIQYSSPFGVQFKTVQSQNDLTDETNIGETLYLLGEATNNIDDIGFISVEKT